MLSYDLALLQVSAGRLLPTGMATPSAAPSVPQRPEASTGQQQQAQQHQENQHQQQSLAAGVSQDRRPSGGGQDPRSAAATAGAPSLQHVKMEDGSVEVMSGKHGSERMQVDGHGHGQAAPMQAAASSRSLGTSGRPAAAGGVAGASVQQASVSGPAREQSQLERWQSVTLSKQDLREALGGAPPGQVRCFLNRGSAELEHRAWKFPPYRAHTRACLFAASEPQLHVHMGLERVLDPSNAAPQQPACPPPEPWSL